MFKDANEVYRALSCGEKLRLRSWGPDSYISLHEEVGEPELRGIINLMLEPNNVSHYRPKREPKPGEVWVWKRIPFIVRRKLELISLINGGTLSPVTAKEAQFAAASVEEYYRNKEQNK